MKDSISKIPRVVDMDGGVLSIEEISACLKDDQELLERLINSGAIQRAHAMKKELRADPLRFLKEQDRQYGNDMSGWNVKKGGENDDKGTSSDSAMNDTGLGDRKKNSRVRDNQRTGGSKRVATSTSGIKATTLSIINDLSTRSGGIDGKDGNVTTHNNKTNSQPITGLNTLSWYDLQKVSRQKALDHATTVLQDRVILETEMNNQTYVLDAR